MLPQPPSCTCSIDRLWSVTWSLHYRNHNSTRKSLYIILGTWCLVGFIWLPPFLYDRVVNVYAAGDCYWDTVLNKNLVREGKETVAYVGFLGYYTPLLVMLGAYAKILLVVRKRAASIRDAARKVRG
ncbi:Alpha-2B adrenergic receptor [Portunus trituberculatus]|uniref:Alpha-2B adrenergic receptor n=1 Tax=Portunus trituberculatus TaxID=210409 RepID=A0A5B7HI43_PORTR|nr:Alpha-2B adrenergic receptor [Portunus trituberculatus]